MLAIPMRSPVKSSYVSIPSAHMSIPGETSTYSCCPDLSAAATCRPPYIELDPIQAWPPIDSMYILL